MPHKVDSHIVNTINFMSQFRVEFYVFRGFMQIETSFGHWGMLLDDYYWAATHVSREPIYSVISDEAEKELSQIDDGYVWAIVLKGNDDTSYVKRFKTQPKLREWWENTNLITQTSDLLYLN